MLAEAETDDFINDPPKSQVDQSGEWKETNEEIQWVASENNSTEDKKKEEDDEELDLNKGRHYTLDKCKYIFFCHFGRQLILVWRLNKRTL